MSILRQRVRSSRARPGRTTVPLVQKCQARAAAVDVYGQLAGNHEGEGSHRKKGKATKPGLSRRDHGQTRGQAPRLTVPQPGPSKGPRTSVFIPFHPGRLRTSSRGICSRRAGRQCGSKFSNRLHAQGRRREPSEIPLSENPVYRELARVMILSASIIAKRPAS